MAKPYLSMLIMIIVTGIMLLSFNNCDPVGDYMGSITDESLGDDDDDDDDIDPPDDITPPGEKAFFEKVLPQFETVQNCKNCHNQPRFVVPPNVVATLAIYNYNTMKTRMETEVSATDNFIVNKMTGTLAHVGGDRCAIVTQSPCKEVVEWVGLEFPTKASGITGAIVNVSATGAVNGWVIDPADPDGTPNVHIYDGPVGTGSLIETVVADDAGLGLIDGHYFNIQLPPTLRDGQMRNLYVYGVDAVAANIIPNMPYQYAAYTPKAETYFTDNVQPLLQMQCNGCHNGELDYMSQWYNLVYPSPIMGGTKTSNWLVLKGSGQQNHGGGNRCGGVNSGACAEAQNWWDEEFN